MSRTYRHIIIGKFRNDIIDTVPINIKKMWNRWNFDKGYYLQKRIKNREKQAKREINKEVSLWKTKFDYEKNTYKQ